MSLKPTLFSNGALHIIVIQVKMCVSRKYKAVFFVIFTKKYISGRFQIAHARHSNCDYCDVRSILRGENGVSQSQRLNLAN